MSINVQVVACCTNTFLWMHKMILDAAGCSGCPSMQLDVPGCILMYLVAAWCTLMHLDVLACSLMYLIASGCLGCLWMHKLCLDAPTHFYGCPRWPWMLKMTPDTAECSRWPSIQLNVPGCILMYLVTKLDVPQCILMYLLVAWCTWMQLDVLAWGQVEILDLDVPGWYLMLIC